MWVQSPKWNFYLSLSGVKFEYKFLYIYFCLNINFCAKLSFNVIWFVKCMKIKKLKVEIISI